MIPATLQVKCEKFLKDFTSKIPTDKELHLLVDVIKLEEYPCVIDDKGWTFTYSIIKEDERDTFFGDFVKYIQFYEKENKTKKLTKLQVLSKIKSLGYIVSENRMLRFSNPIRTKMLIDIKMNKKHKRYYGHRNRSSLNEDTRINTRGIYRFTPTK